MEPTTRFARSAEGTIAYQVVGDGPVDLIFVPNWGNNIVVWREQPLVDRFLRRLASFSRLIVFDKRGTGVSDPVPLGAIPTLEDWNDDVRVVMDAVGSDRACLFGYGAGSPMTLLFAATHPDRVNALIIGDGQARASRAPDYPVGAPESLRDATREMFSGVWAGDTRVLDLWAPSLAKDEGFRRWYSRYMMLSTSLGQSEHLWQLGWQVDVREVLPTIRSPTLVLHRAGDTFLRVGHGRYIADHIPAAKYIELPGEDHVWFAGDQDAMLDEVQSFITGTRGPADADRVLATVLFTDIVASTERAAALGDRRWRDLLDQHEAIARREVERFRGRLVSMTGDGLFATFDGPARGIRCAGAIAEAVGALGIEIRSGLHTGEVELRGLDVGGIGVHIAARVMGESGPGETVVSSTVKDLVVGSGIEFDDRGAHQLKGVPGEWRLFAVRG